MTMNKRKFSRAENIADTLEVLVLPIAIATILIVGKLVTGMWLGIPEIVATLFN